MLAANGLKRENNMEKITPHLWFDKGAREAAEFYTSVFKDSKINNTTTLHNIPSGTVDIVTVELSKDTIPLDLEAQDI